MAAVVLEASAEEDRGGAAERRDASTITGDGLQAGALGPVRQGRSPKTKIRRGAVDPRAADAPRAPGRSPSCPRSKARSSRSTRATAPSARMVGGFDFDKNKFNHVTQAWRQPGSSFKPFIYSAALEKGFTPATVVNDAPLFFDAGATGSQPWEPKNYDGKFDGPMPLQHGAGQVEEHGLDPHPAGDRHAVRAGLDHALRLRGRQAPGLPDRWRWAPARSRRCRWPPPTACSPTAATASTRC